MPDRDKKQIKSIRCECGECFGVTTFHKTATNFDAENRQYYVTGGWFYVSDFGHLMCRECNKPIISHENL